MPCFYVLHCFPEFAHLLLPAIFPSIRVFSNAAYWIPKCVSFLKIFFFFDGEHFLRVFTEFVTMLLLFHVLVLWPQGMWDLSFPTGSQTHTSCIGRQNLHHWATRDTPQTYSSYNWKSVYTFWPTPPQFPYCPAPGSTTLLPVSLSSAFLDSTCKWYHTVFVFLSGLSHLA